MILWGNEHQGRAEALAEACSESSASVASLPSSSDGPQALTSADATLTVWGHGGSTKFSEMLDVKLGVLIHAWKAKNSQLKTVELVTCDAQHNQQPLAGFAKRVAAFVERKYDDVTIKALPKGQHSDDHSILWANSGSKTFCYVTAPSQTTFDHANQRLQAIEQEIGNDLSLVASRMAKERDLRSPNNFTVNGGALTLLRASLVVVPST